MVLALAIVFQCMSAAGAEDGPARRGRKLRVMVDKVMHHAVDDEGVVRETAEAGFNVICPRSGGQDLARVRRIADLAAKYGIGHMVWMRGTLAARDKAERVRFVWPNGHVAKLYSPNSDEFWQWTNKFITTYARISAAQPALIGVFLDYEMYDRPKFGNAYPLSYDQQILERFAKAQGVEIPALAPKDRKPWLQKQGHHKQFEAFQVAGWRRRCRELRQAVDKHNPRFLFCVYPIPGTKFVAEAAYGPWATPQAPLIMGHAGTYGQRIRFEDYDHALQSRRDGLKQKMIRTRALGIPFRFLSGLDPVGHRGDPEHFGRSAAMISEVTDGYWVFYEGPKYEADHKDYFRWFTRGNQAVEGRNWAFWRKERETPISYSWKPKDPGKRQLAESGVAANVHQLLREQAGFEIRRMSDRYELDSRRLSNFDVVMLQSFRGGPDDAKWLARQLRQYVRNGGGLLLTHDLGWFQQSPFPEIARFGAPAGGDKRRRIPKHKGPLVVKAGHGALGPLRPAATFEPLFPLHTHWLAERAGTVLIEDKSGRAVVVAGSLGSGRVVFAGTFFPHPGHLKRHYRKPLAELARLGLMRWPDGEAYPEGTERQILLGVVRWLAAAGGDKHKAP